MRKELEFYNLLGFYPNRVYFKLIYDRLSIEEKEIYRMYVYSLPFMDDNIKDLIWEYLNGYEESKFDLSKKYREARYKYDKRVRRAKEEGMFYDVEFR